MAFSNDLFQEWRAADRAAGIAERMVVRASLDALSGIGEPATPQQVAYSRHLRGIANDLLHVAMEEMDRRVQQSRSSVLYSGKPT